MSSIPDHYFYKQDSRDDELFYSFPRMVAHIDDSAIDFLTSFYDTQLEENSTVLDIMSSVYSHFPPSKSFDRVVGIGMNYDEMYANDDLDEVIVQNLNKNHDLPFFGETFDHITCAVSIQYLTKPLNVFREMHRILKPGGSVIISFSNRCFPTKAIAAWLQSNDKQQIELVKHYFKNSAQWREINVKIKKTRGDPLFIVWGTKPSILQD